MEAVRTLAGNPLGIGTVHAEHASTNGDEQQFFFPVSDGDSILNAEAIPVLTTSPLKESTSNANADSESDNPETSFDSSKTPQAHQAAAEALAQLPAEIREKLEQARDAVPQIDWEDLPGEIKRWIEKHPRQTAFHVINGAVVFAPALFTGPLLPALGWTAAGPRHQHQLRLHYSLSPTPSQLEVSSLFFQSAQMGGYGVTVVATAARAGSAVSGIANWLFWGRREDGEGAKQDGSREEK